MTEEEEQAEQELLNIVRGSGEVACRVNIFCSDGRWTVDLESFDPALSGVGLGKTFAEAWHTIEGRQFAKRK